MRRWLALALGFFGFVRARIARGMLGLVAPVEIAAPAWSTAAFAPCAPTLLADDDVDETTRAGLAAAWRELGQRAHAQTLALAARTLDLVRLGAPPDVIASANEGSTDMLRRATVCFGLARSLDCQDAVLRAVMPSAVVWPRSREAALAALAIDSAGDAYRGSVAARLDAKLARRTTDRAVRAALAEVSAAEARGVLRAWRVVEWCLAEGGTLVDRALRSFLDDGVSRAPTSALPAVAREGGWERWGIAGATLEQQEVAAATRTTVRRITGMLAGEGSGTRLLAA